MKKLKNSIIILVGLLLLGACQSKKQTGSRVNKLPYYKEASFTPYWNLSESELKTFHTISDFNLIDQSGQKISNKTFDDKIYVVNFFFTTCPGICPKMTSNLSMVQKAYLKDKEVLILSHSVTPSIDSVEVLKHYAEVNDIQQNKWFLATGSRKEIYDLGRNSYFIEEDMGEELKEDDFLHTENFVLIDKNKHIRGIYNGLNKTATQQLIIDIKTLKEAH
ncbi:electron transporter [Wenyingzhuangia fucanilytica]|uniref:Electron transporter n=1 Tax=Wenyingzhuangia fucanilytica TaxID=1790137 RepID=A0A1B1Y3C9_9FLAO|nr:SCO family protein [Wenyingzhuangia fucanilytica]ANW95286.1 electron transporter [Wenyingzhuangia fucanilytica]